MKANAITLTRIILLIGALTLLFKLPKIEQNQIKNPERNPKEHITIILSPHFDDAVLSLGGMMADHDEKKLVATFFASAPTKPMTTEWDTASGFKNSNQATDSRIQENAAALSLFKNIEIRNFDYLDFQYRKASSTNELKKEIENNIFLLLNEHPHEHVDIYGPSYFGEKITHPDHALLHDVFINVSKDSTRSGVTFYLYEDFPYVRHFEKDFPQQNSLSNFLKVYDHVLLTRKVVNIDKVGLSSKLTALQQYPSQIKSISLGLRENVINAQEQFAKKRCLNEKPAPYACEIVYMLNK